jgi:glycine betaine/choline ABC-type transport system substrate-binding protein
LRDTAEKYKIETYDHLKKHSKNFIFGAVHEFFLRDIGFPRLLEEGFNFSEVRDDVDIDDRLSGLLSNEFDVGVGWTTDPMRDNPLLLWIEQSSENTAISQYAMPLCRNVIRDKVQSILKELKIEEQEMRNMNRKAQRQGVATMTIRGIATDFLDKV